MAGHNLMSFRKIGVPEEIHWKKTLVFTALYHNDVWIGKLTGILFPRI